jgi:parallel beta-helix repeat protein
MFRRTVSVIMLTLLLTSMLTLAFNIQPVKARTIVVPDDYPTIQEAINAASSGDTIFAHSGLYYENLVVNRSVSLIGENKYTTIIDGNYSLADVVRIDASFVNVTGFTIRNSMNTPYHCSGIGIMGWPTINHNISGNILTGNYYGITLNSASNSIFSNNIVTNNTIGVEEEYSSSNYDVLVMNADGTNQTQLTSGISWDSYPAWSPDGTKILFTRNDPTSDIICLKIWTMNTDGTGQTRLTTGSAADYGGTWSPDGSQIAYWSAEIADFSRIWVMNSDGTNQRQLTTGPLEDGRRPVWSPDGAKIAFSSYRAGKCDLWTMNADGTNQTLLYSTGTLGAECGSWSPDGTKIAFHSGQWGSQKFWDIWVINSDGTNPVKLSSSGWLEMNPRWSPDGSKIAYDCAEDWWWDIWVMNTDGTGKTRLRTGPTQGQTCSWSPDGLRLAFVGVEWHIPKCDMIINNTISYNKQQGINLQGAIGVLVEDNQIHNNGDGLVLSGARNDSIVDNVITDNAGVGVYLNMAGSNFLRSNNMTDNGLNFCVDWQASEDYMNDVDESNTVNGKPIYYWINQSDRQVPTDAGCVLLVNSTNMLVENLPNLEHNGFGVELYATTNSTIRNVTASNNANGIYLYLSNGTTILNNTASNNANGILLLNSKDNVLRDNVMMQNQIDFGAAVLGPHVLEDWINDVDESNTVEGKPVYYWVDQHDRTVPSDGGLVYLIFCSAISVKDMDISDNLFGVCMIGTYNSTVENVNVQNCALGFLLFGSTGNTIDNNTVTNGQSFVWNGMTILASDGIVLLMSNDNTVTSNTISNMQDPAGPPTPQEGPPPPGVGIWLMGENNRVFHNNFVNNTHHAIAAYSPSNMWDDGYPSGGNYWSDYAGVDLHSGQYQNETGSDGMGDTPYAIEANNTDHYPLMNPWPSGWKLDFTEPTNHPIVDFAVFNGSLYAAADNRLYVYDQSSWNVVDAPTFVTSLEPYGGKLVVGGKGGLYCYDGTSFDLIFSVSTYIKALGVYNNTLYAGTMLDNPPKLYYCNGSADNPSDWHIDTGFSDVLNFTGPFGSIDSFAAFDSNVDNPVGFWRFNEGSGATAYDSSGNGHDGTINGASWITGIAGSGLGFDGDDLVEIPDSSSLNPSEITVETWVSFDRLAYGGGYSSTDDQMLVCKGGWPRAGSYRLWQAGPNSSFQVLYFDVGPGTYVGSPELVLQTNRWYHIAGTYDGNVIKLYLDGVLQVSKSIGSVPVGNAEPLYFGYHDETGWNYYLNGSLDEVAIYNYARTAEEIRDDYVSEYGKIYITSEGNIFCYNGTAWSIAGTFDDVYAYLDMEIHNGKLYLATRDQGWRKPLYQGGTGFSGRVIEFDGENWTTVLDHDYWVYSLEVYDGKLYAGTANKILAYNGTDWETPFNATEGAYCAVSMIAYDGKIYAGMGNGYIFIDPAPPKPNPETTTVPEFSPATFLTIFMMATLLSAILLRKRKHLSANRLSER